MKILITIEVPETARVTVDGPPPKPAIVAKAEESFQPGELEDVPWPEPEEKSEKCPKCGGPMHLVSAGVSKKTGRKYRAFWGCDERDCEGRKDA